MGNASDMLLRLRPVTFRYKPELNAAGIPQFGLVAEEVAEINPDLVTHDAKGELSTVRYEAVNAMLLNEFLKEHRRVQEQQTTITQIKANAANQEATIAQLRSTITQQQKDFHSAITQQQKQIETLTVGLQKVTAQVESGRPASRIAINDQ